MRISIHTLGTRGDTQPYLALARGLMRQGHDVLLIAPAQFAAMADAEGVAFSPLPRAFLDFLDDPAAKAVLGSASAGFGAGLKLLKFYRGIMRDLLDAEWAATRPFDPQAIIFHPKAIGAPHIAERLGVPALLASPLPGFTPTSDFPSPVVPFASLGPFNRLSHAAMVHAGKLLFAGTLRAWRNSELGLAGRARSAPLAGTLYAYSPHVIPKPGDWGKDVAVTGYWFLDRPGWTLPADLATFLAAGEAPVYVGFGSMPGTDPDRLKRLVIDGLRLAGKRGLLATAGGALAPETAGPDIHVVAEAPHDRIFPLVSAALHHGGAGTTGASLRAGKPTAICPFFGDQPFWARRIAALGVGPPPLDKKTMSADDLAATFQAMDDPAMRDRTASLGARISAEDGVANAVAFIEQQIARQKQSLSS